MKAILILTLTSVCCGGPIVYSSSNRHQEETQVLPERQELEYQITNTWNSMPVTHTPVSLKFKPAAHGLVMEVYAPFFNDSAAPPGAPGRAFDKLWEYEVVESFFLSSLPKQYLEVELSPHGQHLVLLLSDDGPFVKELDLQFKANINGNQWIGTALIPWEYFPPDVDKMNSYVIHGSGTERIYEALYPIPPEEIKVGQEPDFHLLEYFKPFSLKWIMGDNWEQADSKLWKEHCCEALPSDNEDLDLKRKSTDKQNPKTTTFGLG